MKTFEEIKFNTPPLKGISAKNIEEHLKLYSGYVKHTNLILELMEELSQDAEKYAYELGEINRRFSFEFGGMRNHEIYFASLEGSPTTLTKDGPLYNSIKKAWGSIDNFLVRFKAVTLTRGIGWTKLVYDPTSKQLLIIWLDEQHLGQLPDTKTILALDMWEHSYVADYHPSGKKNYVEDFFANLNWKVIEKNFAEATKR